MPDEIDWVAVRSKVEAREADEAIEMLAALSSPAKAWVLVQVAPSAPVALRLVEWLLEQGAALEYGASSSGSPLFHAVRKPRVVKRLLEAGADPNARNQRGHTPLMSAADWGQVRSIKALIAAGAEVNARGKKGETALLFACDQGYGKAVAALLDGGADPETFGPALKAARRNPSLRSDKALIARLGKNRASKKKTTKKKRGT